MMDPNKLCLGGMQTRESGEGRCPSCGFENAEYEKTKSARTLPLQTILAGKYMVGRVLGEGGFGITYLAWDLNLEIPVAIKEYFPSGLVTRDTIAGNSTTVYMMSGDKQVYFKKGLDSFAQEAKNLAKFKNQTGVVSVQEFFFENNTAYLVMEYVKGIELKAYLLQHQKPLGQDKVIEIMSPVLNSLNKIHDSGIIHRDISPDNILIGSDDRITLIDFGAARTTVGNETKSMTVLLKHGYAPPEQYQTKGKQGPWTDIYALCATMYRMLSGVVPEEAIDRMVNDEVRPLKALRTEDPQIQVSDAVSDVIQKGLAIQISDRYQSISALQQDLVLASRGGENLKADASAPMQSGTVPPFGTNSAQTSQRRPVEGTARNQGSQPGSMDRTARKDQAERWTGGSSTKGNAQKNQPAKNQKLVIAGACGVIFLACVILVTALNAKNAGTGKSAKAAGQGIEENQQDLEDTSTETGSGKEEQKSKKPQLTAANIGWVKNWLLQDKKEAGEQLEVAENAGYKEHDDGTCTIYFVGYNQDGNILGNMRRFEVEAQSHGKEMELFDVQESYVGEPAFTKASSSSHLPEFEGITYGPENVIDRNNLTAWEEDGEGYGKGEWVQLSADKEYRVLGVCIKNGYMKDDMRLVKNGQVKKIRIGFSDGSTQDFSLNKTESASQDYSNIIIFKQPVYTSYMKFTIIDNYESAQYIDPVTGAVSTIDDDTAITDIFIIQG